MLEFVRNLINNDYVRVLCTVIMLDTILGFLRSLREKQTNSTIGIDGIIRKVAMICCIIFLSVIDSIVKIDLIGFIPEELKNYLKLKTIGISGLFNVLFIIFEFLSIMKNAILCKLPIPKKLQEFLEVVMKEFTGEIRENVTVISANEVKIEKEER